MTPYLMLLAILVPIAGGGFMLFFHFPDNRMRNLYAEAVVIAGAALALAAICFGSRDAMTVYSFTRGFSVTFRLDGLAMLFGGMVSLMWPLVMLYAFSYMEHENHQDTFFGFYVMTFGVTLGVAFASDMITVYVFYELLTLVTLPLVCHYRDHGSLFAGRRYAAYTIGGAALAFIPVVMTTVYSGEGTFAYGGILQGDFDRDVMLSVYLLGFFGFGVKAAVFPLSHWLPQASVAPTPVTALLHAVAVVNSGVFTVLRMTYYVYGADFVRGTYAQTAALAVSIFTLVWAACEAVRERHFKRRLAWSTVSNLSYMLFGAALMTAQGFEGSMAHMVFHGIIKMTLFLCAGAFMHMTKKEYVYELNGVGRRMPLTFVFYTASALSLTGIPLFCGFVSKWQLFIAGAEEGSLLGAIGVAALILSAFLCAIYSLAPAVRAFFPVRGTDRYPVERSLEAPVLMLIPMAVFSFFNILFGIRTEWILSLLAKIAGGLL